MSDSLLIVDDSSFSRRMIKRAIPQSWEVSITEASGGEDALSQCSNSNFDILFLDITMPDIDGIEVLKRLKAMEYSASVYVISADIQPAIREEAFQLGAKGFLPKPISAEELESFLRQEGVQL